MLPLEQQRQDYAPSDSGTEDDSDSDYDDSGDEPAFRNLPDVPSLRRQLIPDEPAQESDVFMGADNLYHKYVPDWAVLDEDDEPRQPRRPALLQEDGQPSTYAR